MELRFSVPGRPVPKARMTARSVGQRRARRTLDYQARVRSRAFAACHQAGWRPGDGPYAVELRFHIADARRRDLDNLTKSVLDGLQPQPLPDDSTAYVRRLLVEVADCQEGAEGVDVLVSEL